MSELEQREIEAGIVVKAPGQLSQAADGRRTIHIQTIGSLTIDSLTIHASSGFSGKHTQSAAFPIRLRPCCA